MNARWIMAAGLGLGAACTPLGSPVPVVGDTQLLAGEWEGTYASEQTGRSGTIFFQLKAGTDSAYGSVVMAANRPEFPGPGSRFPAPNPVGPVATALSISFLSCTDGQVTGRLDPYDAPETGERVFTTFQGKLSGNVFRGTFTSVYQPHGERVTGKWSVTRKK